MKTLLFSVIAAALLPVGVAQAFQSGCTYQIRPASIVLPSQGSAHPTLGIGLIEITTGANCAWAATTATSWIHLAPPSSGSGSSLAAYMIDPNSGTSSRTGSVSLAGQTQTVIQAGNVSGCTYAVSPANSSVPAAGGNITLTITANTGCFWGVEEFPAWMSTAEYPTGLGTGALVLTVASNREIAARSGTVVIAGRNHAITQAGTGGGAPAQPVPVVPTGGVVNGADYTPNFARGMIISIFGSNLAAGIREAAAVPLPRNLDGVSVEIVDGASVVTAPLYFVSPSQINAQLPFDLKSDSVQVRVWTAQGASEARAITLAQRAPRVFTQSRDGRGAAILAHHPTYRLVAANDPAQAGDVLILYLTGLGAVDPPALTGQPGGDGGAHGPLNYVRGDVRVLVNGQPATVYFAGLDPQFVGVYQVSFQAPSPLAAGTPLLEVEVGGVRSQAQVSFASGGGQWLTVASATVGAAGGAVSGAGVDLVLPAGALASATKISLARAAPPTASDVAALYQLTGMRTDLRSELTLRLDLTRPLRAGEAASIQLRVPGSTSVSAWLDTRVEANRLVATIPAAVLRSLNASAVVRAGVETLAASHRTAANPAADEYVLPTLEVRSLALTRDPDPDLLFEIHSTGVSEINKPLIRRWLQSARQRLAALGFDWKKYPYPFTKVRVYPFLGSTPETWAYQNVGTNLLEFNSLRMETPADQTVMSQTIGHELFHGLQESYDVAGAARPYLSWLWMEEATATWFERRMLDPIGGVPKTVDDNWIFIVMTDKGLQLTPTSESKMVVENHGYGASAFIEYLSAHGYPGILKSVFEYRLANPTALPVDALKATVNDLTAQWKGFIEAWASDSVYNSGKPKNKIMYSNAKWLGKLPVALASDLETFTSGAIAYPALSAQMYRTTLSTNRRLKLRIRLIGGNADTLLLTYRYSDREGMTKLTNAVDYEISNGEEMFKSGGAIFALVVNGRAAPPWQNTTSLELRVDVNYLPQSGCPVPSTGKTLGLSASMTTCGVSGGLDETAKAAWVKAQADKGTSVTADGGTISLTINSDGTGSISPTVTYQCHSWDAKGNDLQRVVNYSLTVDNCYTNMSYCKGTYVVTGGYEIWNKGTPKQYGTSTSSWTVQSQADGTYLLKLPNGYPPLWGDIPYRLK